MQNIKCRIQRDKFFTHLVFCVFFVFYISHAVYADLSSSPKRYNRDDCSTNGEDTDAMMIQSLVFRGNRVFSQQELKKLMQTQEGEIFDRDRFEKDLSAIVSHYRKAGYTFARINNPAQRLFPNGVYLMIELDEGIIGKVSVGGNKRTKDDVIRRELLFRKGSVYNKEDELESERILRRRQSLGKAEIFASRNDDTGKVDIKVEVIDLWTLFPSLSLPIFDDRDSDFTIALSDTNIFGYGQKAKLRYERSSNSEPKNSISGSFIEPRLFDSHFRLLCDFAEKLGKTSWKIELIRPFYSLNTNWSVGFMASDQFDRLEWLSADSGEVVERLVRNERIKYGRITRSFGRRKSQIRLSLWGFLREKKFDPPPVYSEYEDRTTNMIGLSFSRAKVNFIQETFLNKLGRIEDIQLGYNYGMSMGYAPKFIGSDENELKMMFHSIYSQKYGKRNFVDIKFNLQTRRILEHQKDTIAAINARYFLKDFLALRQTLVLRLSGRLGYNLENEQLILNTRNGLRGYDDDRFVGTKIVFLNIEDRMVFFTHPYVVLGGTIFADLAMVDSFSPKKSAGIGLMVGIPKLSGSPVYQLDLAYAFDDEREFSWSRAFSLTMGHLF